MVQRQNRYVLIAPVRDEAAYLQQAIDCFAAQTLTPVKWVIVDDGSSDGTGEIADRAAARYEWIDVVHRRDRGVRAVGPGVIEAFTEGYESLGDFAYDYVCKIDADITLGEGYFERLLDYFDEQPRLGTASGKVFLAVGDKRVEERISDDHVAGQVKFYRRRCFEEIGGFVKAVFWDVIDEHRARMAGWEVRSYRDPALTITHHRLMGSSHRSIIHGRLRWGGGNYFMGSHFLHTMASGIYRMRERPYIVGGMCIMLGHFLSWIRRKPRYGDREFRRRLRRWQLKRIFTGSRSG